MRNSTNRGFKSSALAALTVICFGAAALGLGTATAARPAATAPAAVGSLTDINWGGGTPWHG